MSLTPICIYHANCVDGFTAAWCVREAIGHRLDFIPASYGQEPPDVTGRDVIIVDFSYKRPVLERMALSARSILVLDHHKTAQADLAGLPAPVLDWYEQLKHPCNPCAEFDMERSGAQMAWDFFHGGTRPALIDYVADRDLWHWLLPDSRAVSAVLASHAHNFDTWSDLVASMQDEGFDRARIVSEGEAIIRKIDKDVDAIIGAAARTMKIGGTVVPVANCPPFLASETAGKLAQDAPFAATYYDGPDGRGFSLRSRGEAGADVSEIAASYGGGGHRNAAGFAAKHGWEGEP